MKFYWKGAKMVYECKFSMLDGVFIDKVVTICAHWTANRIVASCTTTNARDFFSHKHMIYEKNANMFGSFIMQANQWQNIEQNEVEQRMNKRQTIVTTTHKKNHRFQPIHINFPINSMYQRRFHINLLFRLLNADMRRVSFDVLIRFSAWFKIHALSIDWSGAELRFSEEETFIWI